MRSFTRLPNGFHMFPYYLRLAGYYCTNKVKEDYILQKDGKVWDDSSNLAVEERNHPLGPSVSRRRRAVDTNTPTAGRNAGQSRIDALG